MHRHRRFAAAVSTVLLTLVGCAPTEQEDSAESGAEAALSSRPSTQAECKAFEDKHPATSTHALSTGERVALPFTSCDTNSAAIFGTIDLAKAQELLAGTGRVPLAVLQKGKPPMGLARLYIVSYGASDAGAYNEFMLLVDSAPEGASRDAKVLEWKNPLSAMLPVFDGEVTPLIHRLILPKESTKAITYGRELLGLDKRAGTVDVKRGDNGIGFWIKDESGATVIRGAFHPDSRITTLVRTIGKLTGAIVGERVKPWDLEMRLRPLVLNRPIEVAGVSFSRDPRGGKGFVKQKTTNWWLPTMNEVTSTNLELQVDASSELGKILADGHFAPAAFATAEHSELKVELVD